MTLWTGFKPQNSASDETIGPNEEEELMKEIKIFEVFVVLGTISLLFKP